MRLSPLALLFALGASPLAAQIPAPPSPAPVITPQPGQVGPTATLSLAEAQQLARRNNPDLQQVVGAQRSAHAQLKSAYGAFLPSADVSFGSQYREGRPQFFNGQTIGATSATMSSSYDLSLQARYSPSTFIAPKLERANVRAAEADVEGSAHRLQATISQQYLTVLQMQARATLQDTLLTNARLQLELAKARAAVGSGTALDVRRAEVQVGQQQVAVLQARNNVEIEKLRLFQQMGVNQPANVVLTTDFPIEPLRQPVEELLDMARRQNPVLNAVRSRQSAADLSYRSAQSQYAPTLSLFTGWGGYASEYTDKSFVVDQALQDARSSCFSTQFVRAAADLPPSEDCSSIVLTPAERTSALNTNNQYPFTFQRNPWQVQAQISVPIFNGFTREQRVQEAAVARNNARYNVRAQELALTAGVTGAYLTLNAAQQTVAIQEQNAKTARDALTLAEERYRVGVATFLDVQQARADYERAENDRINAIYEYHKAYAALESAVGRSLR